MAKKRQAKKPVSKPALWSELIGENPLPLLAKIGSICVHAEELIGPTGHHFDREVLVDLLADDDVSEFLGRMSKAALLPVKR